MGTCGIARSLSVCIGSLLLVLPVLAAAETFVCTAGDVGCVVASIAKSNANGPAHDYLFLQAGTYLLDRPDHGADPLGHYGTGLPVVTGALTIVGGGTGTTLLARAQKPPLFRLLDVARTGGLTLAYLTLAGGNMVHSVGRDGGCIHNAGSMMLIDVVVRECAANYGGAIANHGELLIQHSVIVDNFGEFSGGAILSSGVLTIKQGSWIGDSSAYHGGCITASGQLTLDRSVVNGCVAFRIDGGGIDMWGAATITSSLISDNFAYDNGGGAVLTQGTVTITNSTLWDNTAGWNGGGLYVREGEATLSEVAVLFNSAGEVPAGYTDYSRPGPETGGGIATTGEGIATLERVWLLWNEAPVRAQCFGNVTARGWVVSGDPTIFHTGSPCD